MSSFNGLTILRDSATARTTESAAFAVVKKTICAIRLFLAASISAVGAVMASLIPLLRLHSAMRFSMPRQV